MKLSTTLLLPSVLALVSVPAMAATQGSSFASLTHITFTLTDLDPNDGIDPSIDWGTYHLEGSVGADGRRENASKVPGVVFQDATYEAAGEHSSAKLVIGAEGSITASAEFADDGDWGTAHGYSHYRGDPMNGNWRNTVDPVLSPNTKLTVTGFGSASTSCTANSDASFCSHGAHGYSSFASVSLILRPLDHSGQQSGDSILLVPDTQGTSFSESRQLSVSFSNTSTEAVDFGLVMSVSAFIAQPTAPVPEPSTYLLMGAGLGAMAWARRRQRKACA